MKRRAPPAMLRTPPPQHSPHMTDHLQRSAVLELPYLIDGARVFVATNDQGWAIGSPLTARTEEEVDRVVSRLNDVLDAFGSRPRLALLS